MRSGKHLLGIILVGMCLPVLGSCTKKEPSGPQIRTLTPEEQARIAPPLDVYKPRGRRDIRMDETLPPERQEAMGDLLMKSKEYEGSLLHYIQILQNNPERQDIRYKVAVILLLKGQYKEAREELTRVLTARPEMLEAREALAIAHLQEKDYNQAIQEFRTILQQDRSRAQTHHLLGVSYLMANQPREAIQELETANSLNPKNLATYGALGQAHNRVKNYQKAYTILKKGQSLNPNHSKINYQIGMALAGLKRYDEAFAAFVKSSDEAQAYNNIGVYYFADGEYETAAKCFQKALELRPTFYQEAKNNLDKAMEKLQEGKIQEGR
jgi:tetratricopeptide (TPR) repeat protein